MNSKLATRIIKKSNYSPGYTLVEMLISLVLGILVTAGIFQVYLSNKQSYRLVEGQSRLQENARFALSFLTEDIRMAGYTGCVSRGVTASSIVNIPAPPATNYLYDLALPLQGFEWDEVANNWAAQPGGLPIVDDSIAHVDNATISDIITVRRAASQGFTVSSHVNSAADVAYTNNTALTPLFACDFVVVSNCSAATLFQISSFTGAFQVDYGLAGCALNNSSTDLLQLYDDGQIYSYRNISYFIRNFRDNGQLIPTLYRVVNSQPVEQLVEGIERMQIVYGVDLINDGSADQFFNAAQFSPTTVGGPNWNQVVSVRISLLVASIEGNLVRQPAAFRFNGMTAAADVNVADGRLRRQFTSTIAIRNTLR